MKSYWGFALAAAFALAPATIASAQVQLYISTAYDYSMDGSGNTTTLPNIAVSGGGVTQSQVNVTSSTYVNHVFNVYANVTGLTSDQNAELLLFGGSTTGAATAGAYTANTYTITPPGAPTATWYDFNQGSGSGTTAPVYEVGVATGSTTGTFGAYAAALNLGVGTPFLLGQQIVTCNGAGGYNFVFKPNPGYLQVLNGNTGGAATDWSAASYPTYSATGDSALFAPRASTDITWTNGSGAATWAVADGNLHWATTSGGSPTDFYHMDTVHFNGNNPANSTVTLVGNLSPTAVVVNSSTDYVFTGAGAIIGAGTTLTKQGSGKLTIDNTTANSYTGLTTVSGGTLQIGNGDTNGSLPGNVSNSGTLAFNRTDTVTYSSAITGPGTISQQGSGTLILTGNNTAGATVVSAGTLQIGAGSTIGSLASDITDNSSVVFNRNDNLTYSGAITGSGAVTQQGSGTLTVTGSCGPAATIVAAGTLQIGAGGTTGSLAGNISNSGAVVFNRSDSVTYSGAITGSGTLVQNGSGTLTLTGASAPGGNTTVSTGTLQVGNGLTTGSLAGNITLANNANVTYNRSDAVSVTGNIGGVGSVTKVAAGTVTLSGTNGYSGLTTTKGGTLQLNGPGARNPILTGGGTDIQNGWTKEVFDYSGTGDTDPASGPGGIQALLTASYDNGKWDTGKFQSSTAVAAGTTLGWKDTGTQVIVMDTLPGDITLDGSVNALDLNILLAHYNTTGDTWATGDLNYDGKTNALDLNILLARYNTSLPPGVSGVTLFPEPGTLVLLAAGVFGLLAFAWKNRK